MSLQQQDAPSATWDQQDPHLHKPNCHAQQAQFLQLIMRTPDLTTQKPPPRTVPYEPPEETIEVHHNYISAVSNLEHKKDLINRLKQSKPHNILTYEAEMTHHMALHNDVLGRIHTILKQDDYFRTLEELPVIDGLHAYNDIQLFPKLFDTSAVMERVTSEADFIEKQLNRSDMYPLPQTLYHVFLVSSPDPVQHLGLLHQLHHHLQQEK